MGFELKSRKIEITGNGVLIMKKIDELWLWPLLADAFAEAPALLLYLQFIADV